MTSIARAMRRAAWVIALLTSAACHGPTGPSGPPVLFSANAVNPASVNAISTFNSCAGHAFPSTNSPNSAKIYFWPTSMAFSTNNQLQEYAVCDGVISQTSADTAPNEQDRGQTFHLSCDNSSTRVRYFHLTINSGLLGQHVHSGDFIGYASMLRLGQTPSDTWQHSSNFDIAVSEGDDAKTINYFAKLTAAAFAAWSARGLTSLSQTINAGNPTCASFLSDIGSPDVLSFTPPF